MEATIKVIYGCLHSECLMHDKCIHYIEAQKNKFKYYVVPTHKVNDGCEWFLSNGV
jgi:hypothetical protein